MAYLDEQQAAAGAVPDDRTIVIERSRDDLGDWRVAVLSPLGSRVHAPWAMAAVAQIRDQAGIDVEVMWSDDGFVIRPGLFHFTHHRADLERGSAALWGAMRSGAVRADVRQRFALKDAADAHRALESRKTVGATILQP